MDDNSKFGKAKIIVKMAVIGLVELFTGAVVENVIGQVGGGHVSKIGARVGGTLVGLMLGDQVGDFICDEIDDTLGTLDELKEAIESEEE